MPLLRMVGRTAVVAGTATAVSGRVARRQGERWQQQEAEQTQAQAPPPAEEGGDNKIAELKQLAELHEQGVLTDEEFAVQKAKLLD